MKTPALVASVTLVGVVILGLFVRGCVDDSRVREAEAREAAVADSLRIARDSLDRMIDVADSALVADSVAQAEADSLARVAESERKRANEASERHANALERLRRVTAGVDGSDSLADAVAREHREAMARADSAYQAKSRESETHEARADSLVLVVLGLRDAAVEYETRVDSLLAAKDDVIAAWRRKAQGFRVLGISLRCVGGASAAVGFGGSVAGAGLTCGVPIGG